VNLELLAALAVAAVLLSLPPLTVVGAIYALWRFGLPGAVEEALPLRGRWLRYFATTLLVMLAAVLALLSLETFGSLGGGVGVGPR
jgi:hypothetical protein